MALDQIAGSETGLVAPIQGVESVNGQAAVRLGGSALTALIALLALIAIAGCGGDTGLTVSVAASLGDSMTVVAEEFKSQTGASISLNIGGSLSLTRQVELGAPVDVVVLAGAEGTRRLETAGLVSAGSERRILGNYLVVVARQGSVNQLDSLADLVGEPDGRIAIADSALAPAGAYAEEALRKLGLADKLASRIVPTLDVRSAADAVASGAVKFGIVYRTDAAAFEGLSIVYEIPGALHQPISYLAAPISSSDNPAEAAAFMEFLGTPWVGEVFEDNGFIFIPAR